MNANSCRRVCLAVLNSLAVALIAMLGAGCPSERPAIDAAAKGQITIKGSNTFGEELAPQLITAYNLQQPNVSVTLESKGSGSGVAALLAGECDIAATSRALTNEELAQSRARGVELVEYVIGYYGVAVIVNRSNPTERLAADQVKDIFTGAVRNWSALGGPDMPIKVYIRDPVSGTNLGFRELAMANAPYVDEAQALTSYTGLAEAVALEPGAVGYASMNMAKHRGIKAVSIGKQAPNTLTVNEGWYPYARMLRLYTDKARETPFAKDFVLFVQRKPGQGILEEIGFVQRFEKRLNSLIPD